MPAPSTSNPRNPYDERIDPTTYYAWDVVNGRIVAGYYARLACQRHLDDLEMGPRRGLTWHPDRANYVINFFPTILRVTAGSAEGQPFRLISYTSFVVGNLFGWYRGDRRRFRRCWIEAGKGQIKSPLAAAIGIYLLCFDGVKRAECYAIAKDRNQANVLFDDAVAMVHADLVDGDPGENLISNGTIIARGTGKMTWSLEYTDKSGGYCQFRPLAGDEKVSGPRPVFVAADEIHDWKTAGPLQTWEAAGAKMPGNFLLWMSTNTPGVDQIVGTEYSEMFQKILRNELTDDSSFAYIARTDEKDDPLNDDSCWLKALPCMGITFPKENVELQVASARNSAGAMMSVLRLYFGIPVGSSEYWVDVDKWKDCQKEVNEDDLTAYPCYLAMDLSQKNDLTALGAIWETEFTTKATVRYWKPEENLDYAIAQDKAPYRQWHEEGYINFTPGRAIDYDFVATEVQNMCSRNDVKFMAFDPAHMEEFIKACGRIGFDVWVWEPDKPSGIGLKLVIHSQGAAGMHSKKSLWMPRSLAKLEDRILTQLIDIQNNPITSWCSGNSAVKADEKNNRYFIKKHLRGRIDGVTVLAMLAGAVDADIVSPKRHDLNEFLRNAVVV